MVRKEWNKEENQYLKEHFRSMTNAELAKKFGVTPKAIEGKLRKLRLKRVPAKKKGVPIPKPIPKRKSIDRTKKHENIRCRNCLIVDGYTENENSCRYCGAKLFKDVIF